MFETFSDSVVALITGGLPTGSMLLISWMMLIQSKAPGEELNEVYTQALCGGLIVAAVGAEMFPMLEEANLFGLTIGFVLGLGLIFMLAAQDEYFSEKEKKQIASASAGMVVQGVEGVETGEGITLNPIQKYAETYQAVDLASDSRPRSRGSSANAQDLLNSGGKDKNEQSVNADDAHDDDDDNETQSTTSSVDSGHESAPNYQNADHWTISTAALARQVNTLQGSEENKRMVSKKLQEMYQLTRNMNNKSEQLVGMTVFNEQTRELTRSASTERMKYHVGTSDLRQDTLKGSSNTQSNSNNNSSSNLIRTSIGSNEDFYNPPEAGSILHLSPSAEKLSIAAAEKLADSLDGDVHRLQYLVDHCRRILEGSASDHIEGFEGGEVDKLISVSRSKFLKKSVKELMNSAATIVKAFNVDEIGNDGNPRSNMTNSPRITGSGGEGDKALKKSGSLSRRKISTEALQEIYSHLRTMDNRLHSLHSTVDRASFRFKRRSQNLGPIPSKGSFIPLSLVIPVIIDCAVDGFLIGLSCALSRRTGLILGLVTCIEMGALGAAYALRIKKCSGNSEFLRKLTITGTPLCILLFAYIGGLSGSVAETHPFAFSVSVGFGVTALLQLACVELLGEAFHAEEGGIVTYALMFLGVWIVLLLDRIV